LKLLLKNYLHGLTAKTCAQISAFCRIIDCFLGTEPDNWIPAFAGMTGGGHFRIVTGSSASMDSQIAGFLDGFFTKPSRLGDQVGHALEHRDPLQDAA
jgi:hypothetical protein